ncbi:MAG TPA: nickel-dependent hydrogenase large subunit [Lachnospiraceae bacterium]|nr:nickel-dependent hydrogenase large subunit [Lachnospiraceae bacterium]
MGDIVTINPITRISGFLEIQVEIENNVVIDAKSSGLLFRGFEKMLRGRPPLDAIYFTERICGICSTAHSHASTLALESILRVKPNENDKMIRDFMHGCEYIQNHLRHFYIYTLPDYVRGPKLQPLYMTDPIDFRLPEDIDAEISNHYVESVRLSRLAHEMLAVLGGKAPHNHGIFVGGVSVNFNISKYVKIRSILSEIKTFVEEKMIPDVNIIGEYYKDYYEMGVGYRNLMSYGIFDTYKEQDITYLGPQVMIEGTRGEFNPDGITETVHRAWYDSEGEQVLGPLSIGNDPNIRKEDAYTFIKTPRYEGVPMEVGPLARMYLSNLYTRGIATMDRTVARVLEVQKIIQILEGLLEHISLQATEQGRYEFLETAEGKGLIDTTRGSLGHWIAVEGGRIKNYGIISPSTWNLSPTDAKGLKGVIEKALIGTTIQDVRNPIEVGRIVRAFDPCVSCATHIVSDKFTPFEVRVV